jgi:hypothetical protein
MNTTRRTTLARNCNSLIATVLLGTSACVAEVDDDPVSMTTAAFTSEECGRWFGPTNANSTQGDQFFEVPEPASSLPVITPHTYSNPGCWRGFVVDGFIPVADTTLNTGGGPTAKVTVSWNDALPSNKTECNNTYMVGIVYNFTIETPKWGFSDVGSITSSGKWLGWPFNRCLISPMVFDSATYLQHLEPGLEAGGKSHYRFAITGRAPSRATRSLRFDYTPPTIIH